MLATILEMASAIYLSIIESPLVAVRRVGCTSLSLSRSVCEQILTKVIHEIQPSLISHSLEKLQQVSVLVAGVFRSGCLQVGAFLADVAIYPWCFRWS